LNTSTFRTNAAWFVLPVVMLFSVVGAEWGLARGFSLGVWGLAVTVANLAAIGLLEQVLPLRAGTGLFRDRQSWNDIGFARPNGCSRKRASAVGAASRTDRRARLVQALLGISLVVCTGHQRHER